MKKILLMLLIVFLLVGCQSNLERDIEYPSADNKSTVEQKEKTDEDQESSLDDNTEKEVSDEIQNNNQSKKISASETIQSEDTHKTIEQNQTIDSQKTKDNITKKSPEIKKEEKTDKYSDDKKETSKQKQSDKKDETKKNSQTSEIISGDRNEELKEDKLFHEDKPTQYDIGNSGQLFDTEEEAVAEAEKKFNSFDDKEKYVSSYTIYSTYDKWTISYYYTYY